MWLEPASSAASAAREVQSTAVPGFWTWPGWTALAALLTGLTLLAAALALRYARDSAIAARDTVRPLQTMATDLAATAETMKANLELVERGRAEERLIRRLQRYEGVVAALTRMVLADRPQEQRDGQVALQAALAPLPETELPAAWAVARATFQEPAPKGGASSALTQVREALVKIQAELDKLLHSPG